LYTLNLKCPDPLDCMDAKISDDLDAIVQLSIIENNTYTFNYNNKNDIKYLIIN